MARRDRDREELLAQADVALEAGDVDQYRMLYARAVRSRRRDFRVTLAAMRLALADGATALRTFDRTFPADVRRAA